MTSEAAHDLTTSCKWVKSCGGRFEIQLGVREQVDDSKVKPSLIISEKSGIIRKRNKTIESPHIVYIKIKKYSNEYQSKYLIQVII